MNINSIIDKETLAEKDFARKAKISISISITCCLALFLCNLFLSALFPQTDDEIIIQLYDIASSLIFIGIPFFVAGILFRRINNIDVKPFKRKAPKKPLLYIFGALGCGYITTLTLNQLFPQFVERFSIESSIDIPESTLGIILFFIRIAVIPALIEEWAYRGVILKNLLPYGKSGAIFISSLLFGLSHMELPQAIFATVFGLVLGLCYEYTNSLLLPIIIHFANNFVSAYFTVFMNNSTIMLFGDIFVVSVMIIAIIAIIYYTKNGIAHKRISFNKPDVVGYKLKFREYMAKFFTNPAIIPYTLVFLFIMYLLYSNV